jgi:hypothetical protein
MKYIKYYESELKPLSSNELQKIQNGIFPSDPYIEENITDNNIYKVTEKANNWYYKIKYYYKKPKYKTYCFLKVDEKKETSQFWIEEDKLMIPSKEELQNYKQIKMQHKYNL